jgi:hypothetical protein
MSIGVREHLKAAMLAYAVFASFAALATADSCSKSFSTVEAFESEVMDDDKVWAVVFHSAKKGASTAASTPARADVHITRSHGGCSTD